MTTNMVIGGEGLRLVQTVATRDALRRGCCSDAVIDHETVPFRVLVDVARALRGDGAGGCGPYLQDLVRGGGLALRAPTRVKRDPTLERRCVALRDKQEQRKYESMTKDVTNESKTGQGIRMSDVTRELGFGVLRGRRGSGKVVRTGQHHNTGSPGNCRDVHSDDGGGAAVHAARRADVEVIVDCVLAFWALGLKTTSRGVVPVPSRSPAVAPFLLRTPSRSVVLDRQHRHSPVCTPRTARRT
jgi:hypothetical protein